MQKVIVCIIVLSAGIYWAFAAQEDLTLIGKEVVPPNNLISQDESSQTNSVTAPTEPPAEEILKSDSLQEDSFAAMKNFMNQENMKEKEIRLLNLDLERINLQLKRQKLLSDIQGLSRGDQSTNLDTVDIQTEPLRDTRIVYLVYSPNFKEVILDMNGTVHRLRENDQTGLGVTVKNILEDGVVIEAKDGVETKIPFLGTNDL